MGTTVEVMMGRSTEVQKSPTKFDVSNFVSSQSDEITLEQLWGLDNYRRVTVTVKVIHAKEVVQVKGLSKQDYIIGDASGTSTLTV